MTVLPLVELKRKLMRERVNKFVVGYSKTKHLLFLVLNVNLARHLRHAKTHLRLKEPVFCAG